MTRASSPLAGAVTFAFTDIEGSTARWERDRVAMQDAVRRHDKILREAIQRRGGRVFKTIGDAFCAAFPQPEDAAAAMVEAQVALAAEDFTAVGGLPVRVAIHNGIAEAREGDYFGPAVNKVARLLAIGHGGQILLTHETAELVDGEIAGGTTLRDLGAYHLKDFAEPQRVKQLLAPGLRAEFPPLRSLGTLPSDLSIIDSAEFFAISSFSGRDDQLTSLREALKTDGAIALVHGLGGVGKSSIAREYGWRNRDQYSVVWWLNAQTEDGIIDGLLRLGTMFTQGLDQLADRRVAAQRVINSVLSGFDKPVLLVFDNLEDEALLRAWLPRTGARALVTSRDAALGSDVTAIPLHAWTLDVAVAYLCRASRRADLSESDATAIAEALGSLPLALAHASAALRGMRTTAPQRYLERINEHLKQAPRGAAYPRSVFATFSESIVQAEEQAPGAAAIVCFAASFAPNAIPEELFYQGSPCPGGLVPAVQGSGALDLRSAMTDGLRLDHALATLDRLALLAFATESRTYALHRLVQIAARDLRTDAAAWAEYAVTATLAAFPKVEFANWPQCERVLPHARAVLDSLKPGEESTKAADLARRSAIYLFARGEYVASEQLCARALSILEKTLGPDHTDVARALNNLAVLYMELGRYAESEPLARRALAIRESALTPDDPNIALTLHNLGLISMELGRYADAEALHKRALAIREKAFAHDHPDPVWSRVALGILYRKSGRYEEAEALLSNVLKTRQETLGPDHPDLATSFMHLGEVYAESGRNAEAERMHLRALEMWEKVLGPDHPDLAEGLSGLARVYRDRGDFAKSAAALERAFVIREKSLGPQHPFTKATRDELEALKLAK